MTRTTEQVVSDHLAKRDAGELEADVATNYADDVVLLSAEGVERGPDAVRASAHRLFEALGPSVFRYHVTLVAQEYGFLEWSAVSDTHRIDDGADSFVVRDGCIVMQSVHYTVVRRGA